MASFGGTVYQKIITFHRLEQSINRIILTQRHKKVLHSSVGATAISRCNAAHIG